MLVIRLDEVCAESVAPRLKTKDFTWFLTRRFILLRIGEANTRTRLRYRLLFWRFMV
jgi:hypothetical protein